MRRALAVTMLFAGGLVVWGCGNKDDAKPATTAAPPPTTAAPAKPTATASAAATAVAKPAPVPLPEGRSTPPTLGEWNTLKKEVTVKGSSALKCETKIIREYLRIACKGKIDPEGTPKGIMVEKGGREAMVFAHGDVMSLILPYVEGTDFEAVFSWTAKSHKLAVKWPKGAKAQPVVVGVFEGAASPLDGTVKGDFEKLCACHKKITGLADCDSIYGGPDPDCDRTYGDDCKALLLCAGGEPMHQPRCSPGFINAYGLGRCHKMCWPGKDPCPAGFSCEGDWGPQPVCVPK